ncbi:MAG: 50S ribosomal protein L13 [Clostridia bacterium]|nr:50S ribosomal protein L13 [Clostridia bacterium]
MSVNFNKTYQANGEQVERKWYVIDADGLILGRLASEVARILRGKHKPIYTPSVDTGDHVIVINASKVRLTGNKLQKKMYYRHSNWPEGLKAMNYAKFLATRPERVIEKAVRGMLPRNSLGRQMFRKLKVYAGPQHPHEAQKPVKLELPQARA